MNKSIGSILGIPKEEGKVMIDIVARNLFEFIKEFDSPAEVKAHTCLRAYDEFAAIRSEPVTPAHLILIGMTVEQGYNAAKSMSNNPLARIFKKQ